MPACEFARLRVACPNCGLTPAPQQTVATLTEPRRRTNTASMVRTTTITRKYIRGKCAVTWKLLNVGMGSNQLLTAWIHGSCFQANEIRHGHSFRVDHKYLMQAGFGRTISLLPVAGQQFQEQVKEQRGRAQPDFDVRTLGDHSRFRTLEGFTSLYSNA